MNSTQLSKTWSNFSALYGHFEYLSVYIDDNIAHTTMVCCCSNKICDHTNKLNVITSLKSPIVKAFSMWKPASSDNIFYVSQL